MIYVLQITGNAYTTHLLCEAEISPSLENVDALPERASKFQGWGEIDLEFSQVNYHEVVGFFSPRCEERYRPKTRWYGSSSLFIKVSLDEYSEKRDGSFGGTLDGDIGSISASYSYEFQIKYDRLHARGYGIKARLKGNPFDLVIYKQDKSVLAYGYLEDASTGYLCTLCSGFDLHNCQNYY